jgi:small GTP-binding protein
MTRTLKVVIIGNGSAGKSSLRARYLNNTYQPAYISTIGADFISKSIEVSVPIPTYLHRESKQYDTEGGLQNGEVQASTSSQPLKFKTEKIRITFSIWDTAGQERFKSLGSAFYRGSDAVIIAFDLATKGALARTLNWYNDFCRLGDIGYEEERMNSRQLKRAREQRERFCWVGVGCKGDLLQDLSERRGNDEEKLWRGVGWAEARGWFDTMIPRRLPEGEEEKQGYPNINHQDSEGEAALPYTLGQDVPARPEDVLSRPNKGSTSTQSGNGGMEAGVHLGRPTEAGLPPGTAPAPGKALQKQQQLQHRSPRKSLTHKEGKGKGLGEKRKSIRSIDIWQGYHSDALGSSLATATSASPSNSASNRRASGSITREGSQRSRYDSATSTGGSVYYSVRGSTILSQSPAGGSASSPTTSSSGKTATVRNASLSSQDTRTRKQSNLSESITNGEDDDSHDTQTERDTTSQRADGSSSKTIQGEGDRKGENGVHDSEDDGSDSFPYIPTIPSGDPIPFPSNDDLEDDEEVDTILRGPSIRSKSRSASRSTSRNEQPEQEGQIGRKTKVIAEQTQKLRLEEEEEEGEDEENKRATLYSARPSSISSTVMPDGNEGSLKEDLDGDIIDAGDLYRDQMIEQGFRLFFTSAKDGEGIDDVFEHIARRVAMRWKLEEWEEQTEAERLGGYGRNGQARTAPPTDEEVERERVKRAIKISSGKGTGSCCS